MEEGVIKNQALTLFPRAGFRAYADSTVVRNDESQMTSQPQVIRSAMGSYDRMGSKCREVFYPARLRVCYRLNYFDRLGPQGAVLVKLFLMVEQVIFSANA